VARASSVLPDAGRAHEEQARQRAAPPRDVGLRGRQHVDHRVDRCGLAEQPGLEERPDPLGGERGQGVDELARQAALGAEPPDHAVPVHALAGRCAVGGRPQRPQRPAGLTRVRREPLVEPQQLGHGVVVDPRPGGAPRHPRPAHGAGGGGALREGDRHPLPALEVARVARLQPREVLGRALREEADLAAGDRRPELLAQAGVVAGVPADLEPLGERAHQQPGALPVELRHERGERALPVEPALQQREQQPGRVDLAQRAAPELGGGSGAGPLPRHGGLAAAVGAHEEHAAVGVDRPGHRLDLAVDQDRGLRPRRQGPGHGREQPVAGRARRPDLAERRQAQGLRGGLGGGGPHAEELEQHRAVTEVVPRQELEGEALGEPLERLLAGGAGPARAGAGRESEDPVAGGGQERGELEHERVVDVASAGQLDADGGGLARLEGGQQAEDAAGRVAAIEQALQV
jgi:hypothetical protein